ncbi:hypothetical protein BDZ90DRAFT_231283 [Jaminaea rosea]|uniref:Uncharacterized protein n=1 Tax=Jaminaea rosea TaxID=1569628 RepID=A0A316USL1_9BASI|nr:hypothetical protein BDZ90DRAFT_231283 [Jaminaea rosea]PWN28289.1 hypothetical protein BDZ90DRAFT_231283 [Jaminaea rosea]
MQLVSFQPCVLLIPLFPSLLPHQHSQRRESPLCHRDSTASQSVTVPSLPPSTRRSANAAELTSQRIQSLKHARQSRQL